MAAVALSARDVGIDIQVKTDKVQRIRHKFVSPKEDAVISRGDTISKLHLCWSSKEALYKAWAKRHLEFREHISVVLPETPGLAGQTRGAVRKDSREVHCDIFYRFFEQHILVYAIQK
jgi:4'-phosphopantetheinyl transferase